ncbi:IRA1A protein, partial [Polyodon spathula]|nr:IRA1A protein [Polyodon spathula]
MRGAPRECQQRPQRARGGGTTHSTKGGICQRSPDVNKMISVQMFLVLDLLIMTNVYKGLCPVKPQRYLGYAPASPGVLPQYASLSEKAKPPFQKLPPFVNVHQWSAIKECESTDKTECDFTGIIDHYNDVKLRVRARSGSNTSAWVETEHFNPLNNTELGPPSVKLEVESGVLYVSISDPLENRTNQSVKHYYAQLKYQMIELDPSPSTSIRLEELEPGALYCVEVKAVEDYYHINNQVGKPSKVDCKYIYDNDPTKVVVFVVLGAVVICLFVIGCVFLVRNTPGYVKDLLHPAWNVPGHIAEVKNTVLLIFTCYFPSGEAV